MGLPHRRLTNAALVDAMERLPRIARREYGKDSIIIGLKSDYEESHLM